jgi:hypothetical protein
VTATERERLAANKPALLEFLNSQSAIRARLLTLAASEGLTETVVDSIPADELPLYADIDIDIDDDGLRVCLHLRARCPLCDGKDRNQARRGIA